MKLSMPFPGSRTWTIRLPDFGAWWLLAWTLVVIVWLFMFTIALWAWCLWVTVMLLYVFTIGWVRLLLRL